MLNCPHCGHATIPVWRAFVTTKRSKPFYCPNCKAPVARVVGYRDQVIWLPTAISLFVTINSDVHSVGYMWFISIFSGLFGVSVWMNTIRYREILDIKTGTDDIAIKEGKS